MVAHGLDTTDFDRWMESEIGWPDDQIDLIMDVSDFVEAKGKAMECHRTQFGNEDPNQRLPDEIMKGLMSREYFALAEQKGDNLIDSKPLSGLL
jgi:LmbE family N-acetylglucosaminyl deacetylase